MDNLTHTLFGATLARTPLARAGRGTTVALLLASNAPDIDIVTTMGGAANYLKWHRGPTHGLLGVVGLALVTATLVWAGDRMWTRVRSGSREQVRFGALVKVSIVGVLLHVLMDLPTSYGTRLLSPFDWHWYAIDLMPIIDIYLLAILAACLLFGRTALSGSRNAAIALLLMGLNYGVRIASHHQALAAAPRMFGPTLPERCARAVPAGTLIDRWPPRERSDVLAPSERSESRCLVEIAAMPSFGSPFDWNLVARMSNSYETRAVNVVRLRRPAGETEAPWRLSRHYPNVWTPAVRLAAATPVAQIFLGFSRFPQAGAVTDRQNVTTVRFEDLRFTGPRPPRPPELVRRGSEEPPNIFTVVVRIAPDGGIIEQRLGR